MERIIAAHGKAVYAKNEDLYTVMAGDDGNDYIVEIENNQKIWNKYMPPEEAEQDLACYEGPVLALPNVKIEKTQQHPSGSEEPPLKFVPLSKKKTLTFKPKQTDSPKYQNVLEKESYETPSKKKIIKKKVASAAV
jgi:hypothetical protein